MKILVTGHNGYIGTILTPMLLLRGYSVVGLDSNFFEKCTFGNGIANIPNIKKDIREISIEDLEGFNTIIHLGGLSNDPLGDLNPDLTLDINYKASVKLAKLAKKAGTQRFIFSSSCSNYGAAGDKMIDENGRFNPVTPYGRSKVLVEKEVAKLADSKFCPTFLRNATAYGVSPRLRFDLVLNNLVAWACTTGQIYIKSDGTPWRPIVHIEDISRAIIAILEAPSKLINNEAFNVGRNEDNYQIRDLAEIVKEVVPSCRIKYAKDAGPDKRCYRVDCSKIARIFPGLKLQWNARKGAEQLYESFSKSELSPDDFEGPKFKRIAHIKYLISSGRLDNNLRWIE